MQATLGGSGELATLIRAFDWSKTPLGPMGDWPQSLITATGMVLASPVPIVMLWGPEGVMIYNDAYSGFAGGRHPQLLGSNVREGWPEVADFNDNVMKVGLAGGTLSYKDQELTLYRTGAAEQVFMNLDYSPVYDENGEPAGVVAIVVETSEARRAEIALRESEMLFRFLDDLGRAIGLSSSADEIMAITTRMVADHLGVTSCAYADMDPDQDGFTIRGDFALPGAQSIVGHYSLADFGRLAVHELGAGRPLIINNNLTELAPEEAATFQSIGITATICMPLVREGKLTALMAIHDNKPRQWTATELNTIREVTERCWAHIERVGAEAELRENVERYRLAGRATRDPIWDWNLITDQVQWNDAIHALFGYAPDQVGPTVEWWMQHIHPEDRDRIARDIDAVIVGSGETWSGEYRFLHADGHAVHVLDRGYVLRDASGKAVRMIGAMLDLTQRHQVEALLRESNNRFRAAVDAVQGVLWTNDAQGRMLGEQRDWAALTGQSYEDYQGHGWSAVVHPEDVQPTLDAWEVAVRERRMFAFEHRVRRRDGKFRLFAIRALPTFDTEGEINEWVGVHIDITDQRAAEQQLRELNETLESRVAAEVAERTRAEEALRQSQKMEAVGQLTGGIAHDFNNLLTGISGSLEMMQLRISQGKADAVERYFTAAQGAVKRAAALTHRLLAFSRRQTLDPRATDVNRLVADLEELVLRTVGPSVEVASVRTPGIWPTLVDPNQLENAILNLCINARDAMPDGGRLTIETANINLDEPAARARDLSAGDYVTIAVTDTGVGMSAEVIAKAFEPFFTTKPLGEGTGLGLSMIYGFARQSGGQVQIHSKVGEGTTMRLYLPRHDGEAASEEAQARATAAALEGDGEVVLVVDDEPTIRMLVGEVLAESGYAAIEAADGPSGLRILQSNARIDLLITDVGLPGGMNGRQVADAARILRPNLKILFITGYAEHAVVRNGLLEAGMALITKPFEVAALAKKIRDTLHG